MANEFGKERRSESAKWTHKEIGTSDFSEDLGTKKSWKHVAKEDANYNELPSPKESTTFYEGTQDPMDINGAKPETPTKHVSGPTAHNRKKEK